jgi:hypothetical protein
MPAPKKSNRANMLHLINSCPFSSLTEPALYKPDGRLRKTACRLRGDIYNGDPPL